MEEIEVRSRFGLVWSGGIELSNNGTIRRFTTHTIHGTVDRKIESYLRAKQASGATYYDVSEVREELEALVHEAA